MPALITWWRLDIAELAARAHSDAVAAVGADLLRRLGEPHRRYHTPQHVVEMFWALEDLERQDVIAAREGALGRVAAWFHDAVYDPAAAPGANEAASADLADRDLRALGLRPEDVALVRALVSSTDEHRLPDTGDGLPAAFHDADLWILAAEEERFDEYCRQVRQEYAAVPEQAFRSGRRHVLEGFAHRDSIYATPAAQRQWGERARANLARELARLSG